MQVKAWRTKRNEDEARSVRLHYRALKRRSRYQTLVTEEKFTSLEHGTKKSSFPIRLGGIGDYQQE